MDKLVAGSGDELANDQELMQDSGLRFGISEEILLGRCSSEGNYEMGSFQNIEKMRFIA